MNNANPSLPYTQFLNEKIAVVSPLPPFAEKNTLIELYRWLVLNRLFDEKTIKLQRTGQLGTYPSSCGQEAVAVGIGYALQNEDVFCPAYREHATQLMRGVTMAEILSYWGGDERGNAFKKATQDFPNCIPIATQCLHATGVATAMKLRQQKRATLVVCGDGATSRGEFYEAINLAGIWQLPIVFVINNNQWAISVPRNQQTTAKTLAQKGIAAGIESEQVDGNDVIAVAERVSQALEKARNEYQPTVIEAITYRLGDHTTADDANRYRADAEVQTAWQKDPILRLHNYLIAQKYWDTEKEQTLQESCQNEVAAAVNEYLQRAKSSPEDCFDYLYATLPDSLVEQKADLLHYASNHSR